MKQFSRFLLWITFFLTLAYILFRIFFTLPIHLGLVSLLFGIMVLLVEILDSIDFFIYIFNILLTKEQNLSIPNTETIINYPDVDVLIATYNEDIKILKKTIDGCLKMKYPSSDSVHIYLCDDGNRKEMKTLAENFHINYLSRKTRNHYKAGNYNHAIQKLKSPYIAIFDADMVPTENFLMHTIPFFLEKDSNIGFVQLPQSFTNPDIFQYRFGLENEIPFEQDYFYHHIQLAKSSINAPICCGTNAVISRKALLEANGFSTLSISEDIATGMMIQNNGYQCFALNNVQAYGNAVLDFDGFIKQRSRWARGCLQIFKNYKILKLKGLSFKQKLEYLSCISYWLFGIKRLIYLIAPLLFSLFGVIVVDCNLLLFTALWLPTYLLKRFMIDRISHRYRSSTWQKIYETILTPSIAMATIKELFNFQKTSKFEVTPKNKESHFSKKNIEILAIHTVLLLLNILGFSICVYKIITASVPYIYLFSCLWTLSNIFYLLIAIIFDTNIHHREIKDFVPNQKMRFTNKSILKIFTTISTKKRRITN